MLYFCLFAALVILGISIFFAIKNRFNISGWISYILVGVFLSTFFFVLPTEWIKEGKEVLSEPLYSVLSSLLYSLKALGGRQDIDQLESIALSGALKTAYIYINYIAFAAAPILASSLILSFIGDTGERLRYLFSFSKKCYVFSKINTNSIALAKGVKSRTHKKTLVFCDAKNADKALIAGAKELGAIILYKSCKDLKLSHRFGSYEFFLICEEEENNIALAESFIEKREKVSRHKIIVNAFAQSGTNVNILESLMKKEYCPTEKWQEEPLRIRFIDEIALFCNNLLFENPIYDLKDNRKDICVMLVGCGKLGLRMLKTVVWFGQIDGYALKIRVLDKKAKRIEQELYADCPELKLYNIEFVDTDIETADLYDKINTFSDTTFVCVATGSDELNLATAESIYCAFRRRYSGYIPPIFARVRKSITSGNFEQKGNFLSDRNIKIFGTAESVFSEHTLFNSKLESLAFAVHLCYWNALGKPKNSVIYRAAQHEFYTSEYNRRSSMAVALHLAAKIHSCGKELLCENPFSLENLMLYEEAIKNEDTLNRLAENEHLRWNAFVRSEGFRKADFETVKSYAKNTGSHKDETAKLHPCIVSFDELDTIQKQYDALRLELDLQPNNFKENDKKIVLNLSKIVLSADSDEENL